MVAYRLYLTDNDGHIFSPPTILECTDDAAAIAQAGQIISSKPIEIWQGTRKVALLKPPRWRGADPQPLRGRVLRRDRHESP
jgi:hypothetical protein